MKNYYARFELSADTEADEIEQTLSAAHHDETMDTLSVTESQSVLMDPLTRTHYNRLHLQYQAMAAAVECLEHEDARNTHRWPERFVEYPVDQETLDELS